VEILEDVIKEENKIRAVIRRYAYAPEHIYEWFICNTERGQKPMFAIFEDGTGLFLYKEENAWYVFSEPLAPVVDGANKIMKFCSSALSDNSVQKVVVELSSSIRKSLLRLLRESSLKSRSINYTLVWPVMDMAKYDISLPGRHFKEIRNARNKLYRNFDIRFVNPLTVDTNELLLLVDRWIDKRNASDKVDGNKYKCLILNKFAFASHARVMLVDNKVVGLNAGWGIPNSSGRFYGSVGIHDYSNKDLGIVLYLEDLEYIKAAGYKTADMGGGEKKLTKFKNQFKPISSYKTHVFSITRT